MARIALAAAIAGAVLLAVWALRAETPVVPPEEPPAEREVPRTPEAELLRAAPPPPEEARAPRATWTPPSRWASNVRAYGDVGPWDQCLDLVIVGDGYRAPDLEDGTWWRDVERHAAGILGAIPFRWYRHAINVRAVSVPSLREGCDIAWDRDRVDTALDTAFDATKGRALAVRDVEALRAALGGAGDSDAVLVLGNTPFRGGTGGGRRVQMPGGVVRAATLGSRDPDSVGTAIHELGHYRRIGVWRPWARCRMRSSSDPFCPVCCEEVAKAMVRSTGLSWEDRAYHAAHPLSLGRE